MVVRLQSLNSLAVVVDGLQHVSHVHISGVLVLVDVAVNAVSSGTADLSVALPDGYFLLFILW